MELLESIKLVFAIGVLLVMAGFLFSIGINFAKCKKKMNYYVVSYVYSKGFGRKLICRIDPIDKNTIFNLEKEFACDCGDDALQKQVCIISISKIDSPITPIVEANINGKGDRA